MLWHIWLYAWIISLNNQWLLAHWIDTLHSFMITWIRLVWDKSVHPMNEWMKLFSVTWPPRDQLMFNCVVKSRVQCCLISVWFVPLLPPHREYGLSYLSLRTCIGLWTAFLCILLVATDASSLVCYITRFTEEAFASLICIIFIYEALEKLVHLGDHYPFNKNNNLDKLTTYSYVDNYNNVLFKEWKKGIIVHYI